MFSPFPTHPFFFFFFPPVLLKLQNKKAYSVGLSLAMIMNQLTPLPVPYTKQQIQEDKLGLCQCCNAVVDFTKPFVNEVVKSMEKSSEYNDTELKEELLKLWAFYVSVIYSYNLTKWTVGIYYIGSK